MLQSTPQNSEIANDANNSSPSSYLTKNPMNAAQLSVKNVSWAPKHKSSNVLFSTTFELNAGNILGIVGPNGAGKTTLLRLLYRFHKPTTGSVEINGTDIWKLSARETAKQVAAVLQEHPSDFSLTVREIVSLGRTPFHHGFGSNQEENDQIIVEGAIKLLELEGLTHRYLGTLSGGERQRVMVARALAQEPKLLVLDEPTNHLDIKHQLEILELIRNLAITIVTSLHDLNLASSVCDQILLLKCGQTVGYGQASEVLSEKAVSEAFQVGVHKETLHPSNTEFLTFHLDKEEN